VGRGNTEARRRQSTGALSKCHTAAHGMGGKMGTASGGAHVPQEYYYTNSAAAAVLGLTLLGGEAVGHAYAAGRCPESPISVKLPPALGDPLRSLVGGTLHDLWRSWS